MTRTLQAQRLPAEPQLAAGDELVCQHEGGEVRLQVTRAQPPRENGRWVNGLANGRPAAVWVTW